MGRGMATANTFEYRVLFIGKTLRKMYLNTLEQEPRPKNVHDIKNNLQLQTRSEVEGCGV